MKTVREHRRVVGAAPRLSAAMLFLTCLSACGGGGGASSLQVKIAGAGAQEVPAKPGYTYAVTKTFTGLDRKITTAPSYRVFVAGYDLDASGRGRTLAAPLNADGQVKLEFNLVGDQGEGETAPLKTGSYSATADMFRKAESVLVSTFTGGKESKVVFDRNATAGEVKVNSVSGDTVSGEINLTSGDNSIKGPFTAKVIRL